MSYKAGKLYLCPIINTMGPVTDARHSDLLNSWDDVDRCCDVLFSEDYRNKFPDSAGNPMKFSWFMISWSGFKSNPVHRDFGYFNIYDHYIERYSEQIKKFGDGIFWMYNHPAASGVGNEWGMEWEQNAQYLEILMRFIAERNWYPSVIEVPTEAQDTSHFLENYFPFDLSNRNAVEIQWDAKNADGKTMSQVIDWRRAPHNWETYHPNTSDYQSRGDMKRVVGRLVDIQSIVYVLEEKEIEKAYQLCLEGKDTIVSAYEHDFRDRGAVIHQRLIEPVSRLAKKYPEVSWYYKNSLEAFQATTQSVQSAPPKFSIATDGHGNLVISASGNVFGYAPFTFLKLDNGEYQFIHPLRIGDQKWLIYRTALLSGTQLYIAAHSPAGVPVIESYRI